MWVRCKRAWSWSVENSNVLFFVGGFVFDALTLSRIDSWLDLTMQAAYLAAITWLLLADMRVQHGHWTPTGWLAKLWHYQMEALHFCYGALLSGYVIFYFKSTTASRSLIFFALVVVLMFLNEMPQLRKAGSYLRLGLFTFCVLSFLNYLIPVAIGRMGGWVFASAWLITVLVSWLALRLIVSWTPNPRRAWFELGWSPALILVLLLIFYVMKWIPPVPLSVKYAGVYHQVIYQGGVYRLVYEKPEWYRFWQEDDRPFYAAPGDKVCVFVRIFAPRRFSHEVYARWMYWDERSGGWQKTDRIPLPIHGGRAEGFRGSSIKSNYRPGKWHVQIEAEDTRAIGGVTFEIKEATNGLEREWRENRM